jgi:hypothetical protein
MKHLSDAPLKSRPLALPTNIRIDWQYLAKTNTLAYYVHYGQFFITLGPGANVIKLFTSVIYRFP